MIFWRILECILALNGAQNMSKSRHATSQLFSTNRVLFGANKWGFGTTKSDVFTKSLFKRFAHSAEPLHLVCSVVVSVCACALFFVVFVRDSSCLTLFGYLLGVLGPSRAPFGRLWGFIRLRFGGSEGPWVALGVFGGRFALAAQGPQSRIVSIFPIPF